MASYVFYDEDHTLGNALRYILIKNPKAIPSGWGNKELCIDSETFNEKKWIDFRDKLKSIYAKLKVSEYLIHNYTCDNYHYFLLKI